jgi:endonuclease/exonuclease/phosphatase family metal-dependent hydrolase
MSERTSGATGADLSLTAVSYNIHSGVGRDGHYRPQRILAVIEAAAGSVVALQEVDTRLGEPQRLDQFEYFAEQSGMRWIAGPNIVDHRGRYGNMLLTRLPIEEDRLIRLPSGRSEPRGAICAILRCGAHKLQVVNTHLSLHGAERRAQTRVLLDAAASHRGPTLFMGDFNVWRRRSAALTRLGAPSDPAYAPRTFPSGRPLFALDRIWTRPLPMLREVRTIRSDLTEVASDHLPLLGHVSL